MTSTFDTTLVAMHSETQREGMSQASMVNCVLCCWPYTYVGYRIDTEWPRDYSYRLQDRVHSSNHDTNSRCSGFLLLVN